MERPEAQGLWPCRTAALSIILRELVLLRDVGKRLGPQEIASVAPGLVARTLFDVAKVGLAVSGFRPNALSDAAEDWAVKRIDDASRVQVVSAGPRDLTRIAAVVIVSGAIGLAGGAAEGAGAAAKGGGGVGATFFHGTDVASARGLLAGAELDSGAAAAAKIDGRPGFFLATAAEDAEYFAARRGSGTILQYSFSPTAVQRLGGLKVTPLGPLGKFGQFAGGEAVVGTESFGVFNSLRQSGHITVTPFHF